MSDKVVREKTKYKNIYFNKNTKKYDVKYNFKVYDPLTGKNKYKSKWVYNINTITEARQELAKLQTGEYKTEDKDITIKGAFELWKIKAKAQDFSPVTINNTEEHLQMIKQFIDLDVKLKDLNETVYEKLCADLRSHGYSDETLRSLNATFRKLIILAHKKKLIKENFLLYADNLRIKDNKEEYQLISHDEYLEIDYYFKTHEFWRLGVNNYPKYRLLFSILYYTGIRIGECVALTYYDFENFNYYSKREQENLKPVIVPTSKVLNDEHLRGMRLKINKAYVSEIKLTKDPKNFKHRAIPLVADTQRLYMRIKEEHLMKGGSLSDRIFDWGHSACLTMIKKACKELDLPAYCCHDFRHTNISNLIKRGVPLPVISKVSGDTQETILKNYSHMFESDEVMILKALQDL